MISRMKNLLRIASQLEAIDPIVAYEFSDHLRNLTATDRRFVLELLPREKNLTHPSDKIELIENSSGGWDWMHMNVDGQGSRDITGWRLQPSEVLKIIDKSIVPGPMTDEVKSVLEQEVSAGNTGVPRGSEMGGGPTALPEPRSEEIKSTVADPNPWERGYSVFDSSLASQKLLKKAIHMAYTRPETRPTILPILRKIVKRANSHQ